MLSHTDKAEVFRLGLTVGLFEIPEIVSWADEVIAVDQDPLGKPARLLSDTLGVQSWLKPMSDGSWVVGFFHTAGYGKTPQSYFRWGDEVPVEYLFNAAGLGLAGRWILRDLWRQKDLGEVKGGMQLSIPHHGVRLLRLRAVR